MCANRTRLKERKRERQSKENLEFCVLFSGVADGGQTWPVSHEERFNLLKLCFMPFLASSSGAKDVNHNNLAGQFSILFFLCFQLNEPRLAKCQYGQFVIRCSKFYRFFFRDCFYVCFDF